MKPSTPNSVANAVGRPMGDNRLDRAPTVVRDGLVFYMDNGEARDLSGAGHTVTAGTNVAPTFHTLPATGKKVWRHSQNASHGSVYTITDAADLQTATFTMESWFCVNTVAQHNGVGRLWQRAMKQDLGINYKDAQIGTGTKLYDLALTNFTSGWLDTGYTLTPNRFYHVAETYDGAKLHVYLNGVEVYNTAYVATPSTGNFMIGYDNGQDGFEGFIGASRLYNRALSPAEVLQNYGAEAGLYRGTGPSLVFDMDPTTLNDMSEFGHSTTNTGSVSAMVDNVPARFFDGSSEVASTLNLNVGTNTVEVWAYLNQVTTECHLTELNLTQFFVASGRLCYYNHNGSSWDRLNTSSTTITAGHWYHFVSVRDNAAMTMKTYINGVLDQSGSITGTTNTSPDVTVGEFYGGGSYYLNGYLGCVRLYNSAMNDAEISARYASTAPRFVGSVVTDGLVASFDFADGGMFDKITGQWGTNTGSRLIVLSSGKTARNFDGNDKMTATVPQLSTPLTVEFWYYPTSITGIRSILAFASGSTPTVVTSGDKVLFYLGSEKYKYSSSAIAAGDLNKWHHIVCTADTDTSLTNWSIYVDGVLKNGTPGANTGSCTAFTTTMTLCYTSNWGYNTCGLGCIRIYNRVLGSTEVTQNYWAEKGLYYDDGCVLWYDMENVGGTATVVKDLSPMCIDGTSSGGAVRRTLPSGCTAMFYTSDPSKVSCYPPAVTSVTIESWFRYSKIVPGDTGTIADKDGEYGLRLYPDARLQAMIGTSTHAWGGYALYSTATCPPNRWNHAVFTYDSSTGAGTVYLNGVHTGTANTDGTLLYNASNPLSIGQFGGFVKQLFGAQGLTRLYNRALSAAEVYQKFEEARSRYADDGCIFELDMAETTAAPADKSPASRTVTTPGTTHDPTVVTLSSGARVRQFARASVQYMNTALATDLNTPPLSFEVLFNVTTYNNDEYHMLICNYTANTKGYGLFVYNYGGAGNPAVVLRVCDGSPHETQSAAIAPNTWHHYVGTYDGTTIRGYLDGVAVTPVTGAMVAFDNQLNIGTYQSGSHNMEGQMALMKIYNRILSPAEAKRHFEAEKWRII